jgi:hypothetical protein
VRTYREKLEHGLIELGEHIVNFATPPRDLSDSESLALLRMMQGYVAMRKRCIELGSTLNPNCPITNFLKKNGVKV